MVRKHREILNNRNAIFLLCETSCEAQFRPDVTSFFVGWCIYENFRSLPPRPWLAKIGKALNLETNLRNIFFQSINLYLRSLLLKNKKLITTCNEDKVLAAWNNHKG